MKAKNINLIKRHDLSFNLYALVLNRKSGS